MVNNDITALLLRIKDNIKIVESGEKKQAVLQEIESDFLSLIELIKLFLISERDSYYGYFLMNMQFRVNFTSNSIAGIKLNEFPPVFESNPLLLCKFTLKEIIYVTCHEIDHVVLNHPAEMVKANPDKDEDLFYQFNLAADAAVNDRINNEIEKEKHNFMSPPDGLITSGVLSQMFQLGNIKKMEHYAYYFDLIANKKAKSDDGSGDKNGQQSIMDKQNQKDGISPNGFQEKSDEKKQDQINGDNPEEEAGDDIVTAADCAGNIKDHDWDAGNDAEDAAAAVREFVNASVGIMSEESRGLMPGFFISQVDMINQPPVLSWQKVLKKYVGTITANKRKTRIFAYTYFRKGIRC